MGELVKIEIEVTSEAAKLLRNDPNRLRRIGEMASRMAKEEAAAKHRFFEALRQSQDAAAAAGLTEADVEAELAAYDAERRS